MASAVGAAAPAFANALSAIAAVLPTAGAAAGSGDAATISAATGLAPLINGLGALVNATRLSDYALLSVIQLNDRERTYIDDADALPAAMVRFSNAAAAALGTAVRDR